MELPQYVLERLEREYGYSLAPVASTISVPLSPRPMRLFDAQAASSAGAFY